MGKIAYFESGRTHDRSVAQLGLKGIENIPDWKVRQTNIMQFAAVIINSSVNQDLMSRIRNRLERFVESGGIVVVLGANEAKTRWIPYCTCYDPCSDKITLENKNSVEGTRVFNGIQGRDALKFHDTFVTHGYFTSTVENTMPLIRETDTPQSLVMAILQPPKASGKLLVTTLDPDYHATARHAPGEKAYDQNAAKLLTNIISGWLQWELSRQPTVIKVWRRMKGVSKLSFTWGVTMIMSSICLLSIVCFLLSLISKESFAAIGSVSSIISLASTIVFAVISRR